MCLGANFCLSLLRVEDTSVSQGLARLLSGFLVENNPRISDVIWTQGHRKRREEKKQQQQQKIQCKEQDVEVKRGQNSADMRREG